MTTTFIPQVAVVDFNHHRGPEIELWADPEGEALHAKNDWSELPFLALPDGAHASSEEFSYFTLLSKSLDGAQDTSLFGIACTRQIRTDKLKAKSPEVTRSFVQKAVIVVVDKPGLLGEMRERLAAITAAWFAQGDFSDTEILKEFQATLRHESESRKNEKEAYFGLSLRELIHELRHQTLVLFKCLLLQKRVLFFGTRCERLCMTQFALVSLIPHLLESLQDCASPELNTYSAKVTRATNLRTSERSSLIAYMGLPLQIFGEHSFYSPYAPLQQLPLLSSPTSKSYLSGSTNSIFLQQLDLENAATSSKRYVDVLVNLDDSSKIHILDPSLRSALSLSAADRRWIDHLTSTVLDTWNSTDPSRPTTHGYQGSEDAIRLNFEEYILSLLSSTAYKAHFANHPNPYLGSSGVQDSRYPDPTETAADFNESFLELWSQTPNFKLWESLTREAGIFDIVEPRHPTAGGLNIEDVQRRVGAAVAELNIDERVKHGRETAAQALSVGRARVGAGVARFWKEVEGFKERREQSRSRVRGENEKEKEHTRPSEEAVAHMVVSNASRKSAEAPMTSIRQPAQQNTDTTTTSAAGGWAAALRDRASKVQIQKPAVDTTQVQAAAQQSAAKAGAYLSSWGAWASQKSKEWQEQKQAQGQAGASADQDHHKGIMKGSSQDVGVQRETSSAGAIAAARSAMVPGADGTSLGQTGAGENK